MNQGGGSDRAFASVLDAARSGDARAWEEIYRSFAPKVIGYLRGRHARDPEDIAGEVFIQVVRDLHSFDGDERAFRAWIFTITHHRMLDDARARARRPEMVSPAPYPSFADEPVGDVEAEALLALSEKDILRMLGTLSGDQESVLLLRLFGGLTVPQVAEILGKTAGAVKALQHRGLEALRTALPPARIDLDPEDAMPRETV